MTRLRQGFGVASEWRNKSGCRNPKMGGINGPLSNHYKRSGSVERFRAANGAQASKPARHAGIPARECKSDRQDARRPHSQDGCAPSSHV